MKQFLLAIGLFFNFGMSLASVSLQLEPAHIQAEETFRLILTLDGKQDVGVPDISPLQEDFTIIGTQRSTSYSLVNGQANSFSQWIIELAPKRSGVLPIPALQVGKEKTQALTVEVTEGAAKSKKNFPSDDVFLLAELHPADPYINQQVIYTVKLYNCRRLMNAHYEPPQVDNALVVTLGNGNHYQETIKGRVYDVAEQQYAIFPQKSGELAIKSPVFRAMVYDSNPRKIKVEAKALQLKVKPKLASFNNKNWLPAKKVSLQEHYDDELTAPNQGSTFVRTLSLQAVGVPAQLLPSLDLSSSDQFSSYPEKPIEKNHFQNQELVGSTTTKVTYLLNKSGAITLPAIKIRWFNSVTGKEELSSLPERTIKVTPLNSAAPSTASPSQSQLQPLSSGSDNKQLPLAAAARSSKFTFAGVFSAIFAFAWLTTLLLWFRQGKRAKQTARQVLKQLHKACKQGQAAEARDALLSFARLKWPDETILSLAAIENKVADSFLQQQLKELSQFLYTQDSAKGIWRGEALWQALQRFQASKVPIKMANAPLPPLHRL